MAFLNQYKASINPDFRGRVIACMRKVAVFVLNEDTTTPGYQRRRNLAEAIIANPESEMIVDAFLWECASNGTIESTLTTEGVASAPDTDFEYVVNVVFDSVVNLQKW